MSLYDHCTLLIVHDLFHFESTRSFCRTAESVNVIDTIPLNLVEKDYAELKKMVRETDARGRKPKFCNKGIGHDAELAVGVEDRVPLFVADVQHLIMFSQIGTYSCAPPRWCRLEKYSKITRTYVLIVEDVSVDDYLQHRESFPFIDLKFPYKFEVLNPASYGHDIVEEISDVALTGEL